MELDRQQKEIIVSTSNIPIIRAGYANSIIFIAYSWSALIWQFMTYIGTLYIAKWFALIIGFYLFIFIYNRALSKIIINENYLVMEHPLSRSNICWNVVREVKVLDFPPSLTVILRIKYVNRSLPKFYYFVSPSTSAGSYNDTLDTLSLLLGKR